MNFKQNQQKISDLKKGLRYLKPVIPAGVVCAVIAAALSGYDAPVYEAKTPDLSHLTQVSQEEAAAKALALPETTALPEEARTAAEPAAGAIKKLSTVDDANASYQDGTYTGSAQGYGGPITVEVTIKGGKIAKVTLVSASGETPEYFSRAKALLSTIQNKQSTNVDVVSGATYSSNGIIQAVRNALAKASGQKTADTKMTTSNTGNKKAAKLKKVDESNVTYKDGTYTGSGQGYGGKIKVSVTIKKGKIKTVKILDASDETPEYFNKARKLTTSIVKKQSTNLDTVSGATFSSNGIIDAVRDALQKAGGKNSGKSSDKTKTTTKTKPEKPVKQTLEPDQNAVLTDGLYTGTAQGYGGPITVAVTIRDQKITKIEVTDHEGEDRAYYRLASALPDQIISAQSTDVDVVSGATYSSTGIINAVIDALNKSYAATGPQNTEDPSGQDAAGSDPAGSDPVESKSDDSKSGESKPSEAQSEEAKPAAEGKIYKNGSYTVRSWVYCDDDEDFYDYQISMSVTIENDTITAISDLVNLDHDNINASYLEDAAKGYSSYKGVVSQILASGSAQGIDTVSGATCSSNGILDGVRAALKEAKR